MASDLEKKAKEAFVDDNFELAVDLYTQAIDMDPNNADLFVDRAQANIKLGNYTEAVADANRAIELDHLMAKAYLRKGTAYIKLEEFETAKAALEEGASLAPGDSRFSNLIKECVECIAGLKKRSKKRKEREAQTQKSASIDSTVQTNHGIAGDWQEEVYQKIRSMKELYLPDLTEMLQKIAAKCQLTDSLPQPSKELIEKLKIMKLMLERVIAFLQMSKNNIPPSFREKLGQYERQIILFLNAHRPKKLRQE